MAGPPVPGPPVPGPSVPGPSVPGPPVPGLPTEGHHVFVPSLGADRLTVGAGEGHHLATVLRVRVGDPVSLADDSGTVAQAIVTRVGRGVVDLEVGERYDVPDGHPRVTVIQAVPKGRKMDEVVQRLTEVGVDRLIPVTTARTVKQVGGDKEDKVLQRWRAIGLAAAQQSRRARLVRIDPVAAWPVADAAGVVLYEQATEPLSVVLAGLPPVGEVVLAVGPEGGFESGEVARSGLAPAALGAAILRTETAGLVGATLVMHHLGRLG